MSEWIPEEERLPDRGVPVLVFSILRRRVEVAEHHGGGIFGRGFKNVAVSHWMPLPGPPTCASGEK